MFAKSTPFQMSLFPSSVFILTPDPNQGGSDQHERLGSGGAWPQRQCPVWALGLGLGPAFVADGLRRRLGWARTGGDHHAIGALRGWVLRTTFSQHFFSHHPEKSEEWDVAKLLND